MRNREIWINRISDYRSSGLTAARWCEENGLSIHSLRYHIHQLNKEKKQQESKKAQWISFIPASAEINGSKPMKVTIGQATIEIIPGFDPDTFRTIVRILQEQC